MGEVHDFGDGEDQDYASYPDLLNLSMDVLTQAFEAVKGLVIERDGLQDSLDRHHTEGVCQWCALPHPRQRVGRDD